MKGRLSCIVIDDEKQNQIVLKKMVETFCENLKVKAVSSNINESISLINKHKPDIVFLDIEMPGKSGFELLEHFKNPSFHVIFTSAHAEYALKAIKYAALDYILKPINPRELQVAVKKVFELNENGENFDIEAYESSNTLRDIQINVDSHPTEKIPIKSSSSIELVELKDIISCEANLNQTTIHLKGDKQIVTPIQLKKFEELLPYKMFYRIHKSFIINIEQVLRFNCDKKPHVVMSDDSTIDVAIRRKPGFFSFLMNHYKKDIDVASSPGQ